ncbi:MAG: transcriptional regulator, LysR family [Edaphobacter sp.]|nr:transcriptional regulator, LysR family [Edaphobacter sp.]
MPVLDGVQTIPDKRLAALGHTRRSSIRVPYFGAALECIPQTELVLTATSSIARIAATHPGLRIIEAPPEITAFRFRPSGIPDWTRTRPTSGSDRSS